MSPLSLPIASIPYSLRPRPSVQEARDRALPWRELLTGQSQPLDAFIVRLMQQGGHTAGARAYAQALRVRRGKAALVDWQFGVALALVQALALQAMRTMRLQDAIESLERTVAVALLGEELGLALLLVALDRIGIDDAALLMSMPITVVRERLALAASRMETWHRAETALAA